MKKVSKYWKNIIASVVFLAILICSINAATMVLSRKESYTKYGDMQKNKEYDVLFMGTSHVMNAIMPMEMWNDYGIVSYNCGGNANQLPTTYWIMKNILKEYQTKVMVIDVFCIENNEKVVGERVGIDCQHVSLDWLPLSKEKIEATHFLFDDITTTMEFVAPISIYHSRWSELKEEDFNVVYETAKGGRAGGRWCAPREFNQIDRNDMNLENTLGKEYLCKMIEECQARGIEVLLINIPYPATVEEQQWNNSVQVIADQYGVEYLDLFWEDTGVDFETDCMDENSHLNASGAQKVTEFLGKYLQENYGITDKRNDEAYADWHEDYREFTEDKWELIRSERETISTYLMLLKDKNLNVCLYYNGESEMLETDALRRQVQNLGDLKELESACSAGEDYLMVIDNSSGKVYEHTGDGAVEFPDTALGKISLSEKQDGMRKLAVNDSDLNYLINSRGDVAELMIAAYDKETGELVDWSKFGMTSGVETY